MPDLNFWEEMYSLPEVLDWDLGGFHSVRAALTSATVARFEEAIPLIADALERCGVEVWPWASTNDEYGTVAIRLYADLKGYLDAVRTIPLEGEED